MSVYSPMDDIAEPGHVVGPEPKSRAKGRPAWLLPVLVVATTIIVGLALLFVLREVTAADSVGGCGGG